MMTMVCHITTVHTNRLDPRIFERECCSLSEAGFDVTLIINDGFPDEIKNNVNIQSINTLTKNRLDRAWRVVNLAYKKAIEIDADIYHVHDPELLRIAVKLANKNKKVIFDSHEFTAMQILTKGYLPKLIRQYISKAYKSYEARAINKLSGLVYPCTYEGKEYFNHVIVPKVLIGNFPIKSKLLNIMSVENREPKACYVGGITEARGFYHMVKGCALAEVKLVLIGDMSEELKSTLEEMPEKKWVEYLGQLPHDEALKEATKCSVGLSLLQNQGQYAKIDNLPTKLYEYMALGMPTVVSSFAFYEKVLERYPFGIAVKPDDDEAIARAIKSIMGNKQMAEKMAREGMKCIHEEMNWEADATKLVGFYNSII